MSETKHTPGNRGVLAEQIASLAQNGTATFYEAVLEAIRLYDLTQQARIKELEGKLNHLTPEAIADCAKIGALEGVNDFLHARIEKLEEDVVIEATHNIELMSVNATLTAQVKLLRSIGRAYYKDLVDGRVFILSGTAKEIKEYDDRIEEVHSALAETKEDTT